MVVNHIVDGYADFEKFMKEIPPNTNDPYFFFFKGSLMENGQSWCPACVRAEPVVEEAFKNASENTNFVKVYVGPKEYWKNSSNPFRTDPKTKLLVIPTLIKWKSPQRLDGDQCRKEELLEMMFED